jgi:phosphoserine phosphatase
MTTIILTRHGETAWNVAPVRYRGRADIPLTDTGVAQARAVSRYIDARWRPQAVYASPLERCLVTARAIGEPRGLSPTPLAGLVDIDYGEWQGLTEAEVVERWPDAARTWERTPQLAAIPGGEPLAALFARAWSALCDVLQRHAHGTIVLVGHDSVNRVLLLGALGLPLSRYRRLAQDNCAINEIKFIDDEFTIRSINETSFLTIPAGGDTLG